MLKNLFKKPLFWITTGSITVGGTTTIAFVSSSEPEPTSIVYETEATIAETMEATTSDITVTLRTETGQTEISILEPDTTKPVISTASTSVSTHDLPSDKTEEVSVPADSTTADDDIVPKKETPSSLPQKNDDRKPDAQPEPSQSDNLPTAQQNKEPDPQPEKEPEKQPEPKIQKEPDQNKEPDATNTVDEPEPVKTCSHKWIWTTHTETVHHDAVWKEIPKYSREWDEIIETTKVKCAKCHQLYNDDDDYDMNDYCMASFYDVTVPTGEVIHHDSEIIGTTHELVSEEYDETITVNDYEYCSICGERK